MPDADALPALSDEQVTEPAVDRSQDLSSMVAELRTGEPGSREVECLATGIYFESKGEPLAGQLAVGQVIANRADSAGRFPSTYCGVLFQRGQFSFVHGGRLPHVSRDNRQWQTAVAIAKIVDGGLKIRGRQRALLPRALRLAGLAPQAGRLDRQPRLLPLGFLESGRVADKLRLVRLFLCVLLPICSSDGDGDAARVSLLHR